MGILYSKSLIRSFQRSTQAHKNKLIGVNLIPNNNVKELAPYLCDKDFEFSITEISNAVDYVVINLSGFNKNGLSQYFEEDNLDSLIKTILNTKQDKIGLTAASQIQKKDSVDKKIDQVQLKNALEIKKYFPAILIKIDPDLNSEKQKKICEIALVNKLDGIIIGEMYQKKLEKGENNGFEFFENEDMKNLENQALISVYRQTKGMIPIISSGNIFEGTEIINRVKNGASAVQISSAFILKGYKFFDVLKSQASKELEKNNVQNINMLKGTNVTL